MYVNKKWRTIKEVLKHDVDKRFPSHWLPILMQKFRNELAHSIKMKAIFQVMAMFNCNCNALVCSLC